MAFMGRKLVPIRTVRELAVIIALLMRSSLHWTGHGAFHNWIRLSHR